MTSNKLPNGKRAIVPLEKLTEYALNPQHPVGKHKARVFKAALGLTIEDALMLQQQLQNVALANDAQPALTNAYGKRFVIDFLMTTDDSSATIRSAWIVLNGEDFPRLTTCYVIEDKADEPT